MSQETELTLEAFVALEQASGPDDACGPDGQSPNVAQIELAKDLERREKLCEQAEQVAAEKDWRLGPSDLRRLQDEWGGIRRWHDAREDVLMRRFRAAREAFFAARDAEREQAKQAKERIVAEAKRLAASSNWSEAAQGLAGLVEEWKTVGTTGDRQVDDDLWKTLTAARRAFSERRSEHYAQVESARAQAKQAKERLVELARQAAVVAPDWSAEQWRAASDRMRDLMDQWKAAGSAQRQDNDRLWEQFQSARQPFFDAQRAHREAVEEAQKRAESAKSALVEQARALADAGDYGRDSTERARQLDRDWKELGSAGRQANERLWQAFCTEKERFWEGKRAFNEQRQQLWEQRTREAIDRRRGRIANLQEQVDRLRDRLNHALATDHVEEMQERLEEREKLLVDLKAEVAEMEERLAGRS